MKGVQFVMDENGNKTAVVINLKQYSELWEDFYDSAVPLKLERTSRESHSNRSRKGCLYAERFGRMDKYAIASRDPHARSWSRFPRVSLSEFCRGSRLWRTCSGPTAVES